MKILFIYPNTAGAGEIPISISYLQSVLKKNGHKVKIFDTSDYKVFSSRPDELQIKVGQFKPVKKRDDLPDANIKDADPKKDILWIMDSYKPDLVAVTSFTTNFRLGLSFLTEVKKHFKNVPTIYGGIHTTLVPDEVILDPAIDMICIGEGEGPLVELCDAIEGNRDISGIRNIWLKKNGSIIKNPLRPLIDLNDLPFQDFDGFNDYGFYRPLAGKLYRMANVDISRGCIFKCTYCVNHKFSIMFKDLGRYHREKSVKNAIANLLHIKNKYRIEMMRFWDEDFTTMPLEYLREFTNEYKKSIALPFLIYASASTMREDKLKVLKDAGCATIAMGIESGNKEMRKQVLNRDMSNEKIVKAFQMIKADRIRVSAYNMIGLPFERRKNIFETIELNRKCAPDTSSIAFLEPYPNTEMYSICLKNDFIDPDYVPSYDFLTPHIKEKCISHKMLKGLMKTFVLYTKAPKILYPILRLCEDENKFSDLLFSILVKFYGGH